MNLRYLYNRVALDTACKVMRSSDPLFRIVCELEREENGAFLFRAARRAADELNLDFDDERASENSLMELEDARLYDYVREAKVRDKPLHGVFYKTMEDQGLSQRLTFDFLKAGGLKQETEGFIIACQDSVFNNLVYRSRVMGMEIPDITLEQRH